jgi:NADH-quinone oxidoreductase subunit C
MSQQDSTSLKITFSTDPVAPHGLGDLDTVSTRETSPLTIDTVAQYLSSGVASGALISVESAHAGSPYLFIKPESVVEVSRFLRDDPRIQAINLSVVSAVDYLDKTEDGTEQEARIEVVYVVYSYAFKTQIMYKVKLDRNAPKLPSICSVYRSANWYERECYDMLGVHFEGHPHHERILLPPDWKGHPLRRDYEFPEEYNGMKVPL